MVAKTSISDPIAARAYAKADRRLIPFLFLCYILAYLDRVNIGFAKLQMGKDLALSDAAFATAPAFSSSAISCWKSQATSFSKPWARVSGLPGS